VAIPSAVVDLALGADVTVDPVEWTWTDITRRVRYTPGIQITAGRRDETSESQPSTCNLTLDNTDGRFTPRKPDGEYYPNIRLNTPLRVRLKVVEDGFGRSTSSGFGTADSGQAWSTGGGTGTDFSTTGSVAQIVMGSVNVSRRAVIVDELLDCEQVVTVAASAVATGAAICGEVMFRCDAASAGTEHYRARVEFGLSGALSVKIISRVSGGDSTLDTAALADTYSAGTQVRLRARIDGDTIRARAWLAANDEPTTWQAEATDTDITDAAGVGLRGVLLTGNTNVTPNVQFDNYEVLVDRFVGFVDKWPMGWHQSGNERHVSITASGVLRRLNQGAIARKRHPGSAGRSALYREIMASSSLVAYWPLEGGRSASQVVSPIAGVESMWGDLELGGSDGPGGSDPSLPSLESRGELFAKIPYSGSTSYRIECVAKLGLEGQGAGDGPPILQWSTPGSISLWRIEATDTEFQVTYYVGGSGTTILVSGSPAFDGAWHHLRVDIADNGANIDTDFTVDGVAVDSTTIVGAGFFWPEDVGVLTFDTVEDQALPLGVGHIAVWSDSTVSTNTPDAATGWTGEQASDRVARVCTEEGITSSVVAATGTEIGPQPADGPLAILREVESTDLGLLFDVGGRVDYIARVARYNLAADLELDYNTGQIQHPLEATYDDQQIRNLITISQRDGSTGVTYELTTGEMGTATVGTYEHPVTVNLADEAQLYAHAGWYATTVDDIRHPVVGLNFARSPELVLPWLNAGIGSRVTVANPPAELPPGTLDLQAVGYEEFIHDKVWSVVLNTVPNRQYNVIVLDGTGNTSRFETSGSTLDGAHDSTDTSLAISVDSGPLWDTADEPFDIDIGGEQITVTAVTGASSPQTFTVTRSVNGVTASHADGDDVKLWRPSVLAL
jgi:hypothetical protein